MNERAIFDAALEIADPQARRAFVEKACAGDPAMLLAVESLLKSHDAAGSFLDIPAADQIRATVPSNPDESAALEKTRAYRAGDANDDDADDESQPDLSFLQPSSKPGSMGALGHYEVLSVLGQGAFGIVFKAFDETLRRLVAIKVMNPQLAATSPPRKRFLREARASAAIRHENVVQVYSVEERPLPYLVMEFIDGLTLKQKLDSSGPLETPEVLHIGRQIASGLAAAHGQGLIHRDIKPGNILLELGAEQRVKITDFGLARAADDASLTQSSMIAGTPMYMAPEQATGQTLDHRADLFSLGSVLYQMACGRPPFRAANTVAVLRRVVEDTPRPLQEILPEIPDWLAAIVTKLHAKKPEDRFQTAKEVADLLARCQAELQLNGQVTCVVVPVAESLRDSKKIDNSPATTAPTNSQASGAASAPRFLPALATTGELTPPRSPILSGTRLIAATVISLAVLAGIIFTLRSNDGTVTEIKVPNGSKVAITESSSSPNPQASIPNPSTEAPIDYAAERKAAEWLARVLKVGEFKLRKEDGSLVQMTPAQTALPEGNFTVESVYVVDDGLDDAGLAHLAGCRRLTHANLLSPATNPKVTSAVLDHLRQSPTLKHLDLSRLAVDDRLWPALSQWPGLESATLIECLQLTDQGATSAPRMLNLQTLAIDATRITDKGLETLADRFPNLTTLHFSEDDGENLRTLLPLSRFPKLKTVRCSPLQVTEAGVTVLAEHPQLEHLYLLGRASDATFERLLPLRGRLKSFTLFTTALIASPPTSLAYAQLAQFLRLEAIELFGIQGSPTDADLLRLAELPHLKTLLLRFPETSRFPEVPDAKRHYTPSGIAAFRKARPDVSLHIDGTDYAASSTIPFSVLQTLDETDPLPVWELQPGAPPPVVAPCEPTRATELQQQWAEFLKRPVIEELDVAALARTRTDAKSRAARTETGERGGVSPPVSQDRGANAAPLANGLDVGRSEKDANASTLRFALIPPGEFRKIFTRPGDPAMEPDMPVRRFRITKPYAISTTEVTWDQFRQFVEATGYKRVCPEILACLSFCGVAS